MSKPLISCIMPTYNRRPFIRQAITYFLAQEYPNKELLIIDDGEDKIGDLVPVLDNIRYISISARCSLGMKRNLAVSLAKGEIICHFDDDDYYGPERLSKQAEPLIAGKAKLTGFHMSLLLNACDGTLWECPAWMHDQLFSYGIRAGTLMYPRRVWDWDCTYENISKGEDVRFLSALLQWYDFVKPIVDPSSYICVRHDTNITPGLDTAGWKSVPLERYLSEEDSAFYRQFVEEKSAC